MDERIHLHRLGPGLGLGPVTAYAASLVDPMALCITKESQPQVHRFAAIEKAKFGCVGAGVLAMGCHSWS
jgi:hypothetical protein